METIYYKFNVLNKLDNKENKTMEDAIDSAKNSILVNKVLPKELTSYYFLLK